MGGEYFAISSSSFETRIPMNIIPDGKVAPSVKRIGPSLLASVTEATQVHEPSALRRNESMKVAKLPPSRRTVLLVTERFKDSAEELFTRQGRAGRL